VRNAAAVACSVGLLLAALLTGCSKPVVIPKSDEGQQSSKHDDELFENVVDNLNRLSDYGPDNVLLKQITGRLNQWSRSSKTSVPWQPDPLIETLPESFRANLVEQLESSEYVPYDAVFLREAILMRDTARHVCRDVFDELEMARRLFDWTVDNIALDPNPLPDQPMLAQMPWQTLVFGHGRPDDRAWVFIQLARQQNLDVVLIEVPYGNGVLPWFTALVGAGGELFLFDHTYGLPILDKEGKAIATLKQVAQDENLLRQYDTSEMPYPIEAKDLLQANVLIAADRYYLTRRMKKIESKLSGRRRVVLTYRPSAVAEKLRGTPQLDHVKLWPWPYQAPELIFHDNSPALIAVDRQMAKFKLPKVEREAVLNFDFINGERVAAVDEEKFRENVVFPLWSGRLKHLAGEFGPEKNGRAADPDNEAAALLEVEAANRNAKSLYLLARTLRIDTHGLKQEHVEQVKFLNTIAEANLESATYWLGLIAMEQQDYKLARHFFETTLARWPDGPWRSGARFNLARALELSGETGAAVEQYRQVPAPAKLGALVRAKRLGG
jgi:hypothetical protein